MLVSSFVEPPNWSISSTAGPLITGDSFRAKTCSNFCVPHPLLSLQPCGKYTCRGRGTPTLRSVTHRGSRSQSPRPTLSMCGHQHTAGDGQPVSAAPGTMADDPCQVTWAGATGDQGSQHIMVPGPGTPRHCWLAVLHGVPVTEVTESGPGAFCASYPQGQQAAPRAFEHLNPISLLQE